MKRSNKMLVLLCILAVVCTATWLMTRYNEKQEQIEATGEVILSLSGESVQRLSWSYGDTALAFSRDEDDVWRYDEDVMYPVEQAAIAELLEEFQALTASFVIQEVEDETQYGLAAPSCTIDMETNSGSFTVKLGAFSTLDSLRYVSIGDGKVYLTTTDPMEAFEITLESLFQHDTLPKIDNVTSIHFAGLSNKAILYSEDSGNSYCLDDVWLMDSLPLDTDNVESYLDALTGLSLTNWESYNASTEDLSDYGLDDPDLTISVSYATEAEDGTNTQHTAVVHLGMGTDGFYARLGSSQLIYEITEEEYQALVAVSYNDLRHSQVFTADFDSVTALEITLDGSTYTMTAKEVEVKAEGEETQVVTQIIWSYGETEVEMDSIQSALEALTATSFTGEAPTGQEEIRILLSMDNTYADTMEIALYRVDGTSCLCQINGENICLISRSSAVKLMEAIRAIVLS